MSSNYPKLDPREEHFRIPGPHPELQLSCGIYRRATREESGVPFFTCTGRPFRPLSRSPTVLTEFRGATR
jgi:hypothetical protein